MSKQTIVLFSTIFIDLAKLIKTKTKREMTPLRLQKTLYFVYAFYGATLGLLSEDNEEDNVFEGSSNYPKYLLMNGSKHGNMDQF